MTAEIEVLVAGSGAAGCAAALSAAQHGADVLLIDGDPSFRRGCNTSMSTSMVPAAGSRWQAAAGVVDSPEQFRADIDAKTAGSADPVLAKALTEAAPDLVAWMHDECGVPLSLVTDFVYPGHSQPRCHSVDDRSGETMHGHLLEAVAGHGRITTAVPMRLVELEPDPAGWRVGLGTDGPPEVATAANVVLATSGFAGNAALVERHLPAIADGLYFGGESSRGDALQFGEALRADTAYLDAYQGHGSVAVPMQVLLTWAAIVHGGVMLNADGERFGDESTGYSEFGPLVVAQPGSVAWVVYDARIHQLLQPFKDYQDLLSAGGPTWVEGVDDIAQLIGAPVEAVTRTIDAAARAAAGTAPCPFGRTQWNGALQPPHAVQRVTGALFHTQGGLRVDSHGRVQRAGEPLSGLYAAGGAAHGISGNGPAGYLAGNGLLAALGLGMLSGQHAASAMGTLAS